MNPMQRFKLALASIFLIFVVGTCGYRFLGLPWLEAAYMTVITVTTVGYREIGEQTITPQAMVFTMGLILFGFGTVFYSFTTLIEILVVGQLRELIGRQKVQRRIDALNEHYVICGYGRMGRIVCGELQEDGLPCVVVETDPDTAKEASDDGFLVVVGSGTDDDVLLEAGLARAKGMVTLLSSDADNLYAVLSGRALNRDLEIIARADDDRSEQKLMRAGATRVVAPYRIGGARIAHALLRPTVLDFIEVASRTGTMGLLMEETLVTAKSPLAGRTIRSSNIRGDLGLIVVAVKDKAGELRFNPSADLTISAGDTLLALGERPALKKLEALTDPG